MCELDIIAIWSIGGSVLALIGYSLFRKYNKSKHKPDTDPAPDKNKDSALAK